MMLVADDGFLLQAENLVKGYIRSFYHKTASLQELCQSLTPDCSWIGAGRQEFFPVFSVAKDYFLKQEASQEVPYLYVEDEDFHTQLLAPGLALVCGNYHVFAGRAFPLLDEWQRCTFIVQKQPDGRFGIRHIHISNPWYLMRGTEFFPRVIFAEEERELARELTKEKLPQNVQLSDQQKKILSFLSMGLTYEEIAGKLGISARTVRYHVEQILQKFYVNNRQELLLRYLHLLVKRQKENHLEEK